MRNNILFLFIVSFLLTYNINAQPNWITNSINPTSSALGDGHTITGIYSLATGKNNTVNGSYSAAFGLQNKISGNYAYTFGLNNEATHFSFAAGRYTKASATNSFVFGKGTWAGGVLENNKSHSFLIGFKQNEPGLFVSRNSTNGPIVGIGTDTPQSRLDVRLADKQQVIIQSEVPNTYSGIRFNHSDGNLNWNIRAFSNFTGGYGNILGITSANNTGDFWVQANKILFGGAFNFDSCTDCDDYKLFVKKGIRTEKVKVEIASGIWADYVFDKKYDLKSIDEVEKFITKNGHLPNVPSAKEIEKEGLDLGKMDAKLLEKIEELTLYVIELKKEIDNLKINNDENQK